MKILNPRFLNFSRRRRIWRPCSFFCPIRRRIALSYRIISVAVNMPAWCMRSGDIQPWSDSTTCITVQETIHQVWPDRPKLHPDALSSPQQATSPRKVRINLLESQHLPSLLFVSIPKKSPAASVLKLALHLYVPNSIDEFIPYCDCIPQAGQSRPEAIALNLF